MSHPRPSCSRTLVIVALLLATGANAQVMRAREDPEAREKMKAFWAERIRDVQERNAEGERKARELLQQGRSRRPGSPGGDPAAEAPAPRRGSGTCIFGAEGEVLHAPPGAECRPSPRLGEAPHASDFAAPVVDPSGDWAPLLPGEQALFEVVQKIEASDGGEAETRRGTQLVRVSSGARLPLEVQTTTRLRPEEGGLEEVEREALFVVPEPGSYRIQGMRTNLLGSERTVRFASPARALPERIARGVRWKAGEFAIDGIWYREEGEILGHQDAITPAGTFPDCLVVRHTGSLGGQIAAAPGAVLRVDEGRIERTQWLARGVGPVLVKESVHTVLAAPDGRRVTTRVERQAGLQGVSGPSGGAAAPR